MASGKKLGTTRQLSLRSETPNAERRRKNLKKQFSEEEVKSEQKIRVAFSAKARLVNNSGNRPVIVRQAWTEKVEVKRDEALVTTKCKEVKRPNLKLTKAASLDSDSILYSGNLTNRLRDVWCEREKEKQNLDIFLNQLETSENEDTEEIDTAEKSVNPPKLLQPLTPDFLQEDNNIKNIFQKQLRKQNRLTYYETSTPIKPDPRNNTVVIQPLTEPKEDKLPPTTSTRPSSSPAAAKRQSFQKRSNSAFHGTRPPLVKTPSLPVKPQGKFVATKRRLKSGKRKSSSKAASDEDDAQDVESILAKSVCATGSDVVTMVSLLSPSGSDTEEEKGAKEADGKECQRKSVSFKQSSMHSIRSFTASIPARRNSTGLIHGNYGSKLNNNVKTHEKRTTANIFGDAEESVPKRRLLRTHSTDCAEFKSFQISEVTKVDQPPKEEPPKEKNEEKKNTDESSKEDAKLNSAGSSNERKCWELYRKMSDKGINVSFDTILRGMLTPTEYRLHRSQSVTIDDNC